MNRASKPIFALAAFVVSGLIFAADAPKAPVITKLKKLYPQTTLVENGRPRAIILIPAAPAYRRTAERLQIAIKRATGATLPVRLADDTIDKHWRVNFRAIPSGNIIALGNVNTNRLLARLYGELYVVADSIYPGKGGHVIRTIHDPFARGVNVLALCGSSPAGVGKAVAVFTQKYLKPSGRSLVLPQPIVDVKFEKKKYRFFPDASHSLASKRQPQYTGIAWFRTRWQRSGFMDANGRVITHKDPKAPLNKLTSALSRMEQTWFRTGNPALPPLMKQLVEKNRRILNNSAKGHVMSTRTARDVPHWDRMEELPIWTDRDRLAITNAFLRDIRLGGEKRRMHTQVKEGAVQVLDENHGTNSALGSFVGWQYFDKYYRLPDSEFWMKLARACFAGQASTFQILEDAAGYLTSCPRHSMAYAVRSGDLLYFERGIASHHARYVALACISNLGLYTGFGDASGLVPIGVFNLIARAAWYDRDPRLYWVLRNGMHVNSGLTIFQAPTPVDLDVTPREPDNGPGYGGPGGELGKWTGVIRFPLYESPLHKVRARRKPVFAPRKIVAPECFNKIVFKENWGRDGQYLLLDGAGAWGGGPGPHGHKQDDVNTIINFCALGRMWFVDHSYQVRTFERHSGVYAARDGGVLPSRRRLAELANMADTPGFGAARTRRGAWERTIVWRKGRWFMVLDRVAADRDGEYFARCQFKALGESQLEGCDLRLEQKGRYCMILSDGRAACDVEATTFRNQNVWRKFYPYATPLIKYFQQDKLRRLKAGESMGFINLLYPYASPKDARAVSLQAVGETSALVMDRGEAILVGVGRSPGRGDVFVVSEKTILVLGARDLCRGMVSSDKTCDLGLDATRKTLFVGNREDVEITLAGAPRSISENGKPIAFRVAAGKAHLRLKPGERTLTVAGWQGFGRAASWSRKAIASARAQARVYARKSAGNEGRAETEGFDVETVQLDAPVNVLLKADLDNDGKDEWVAAGPKGVRAYKPTGARIWRFDTKQPVRALAVGDVKGDPANAGPEIAAGCDDEHVYLLDTAGRKQWSFKCKRSTVALAKPPAVDQVWIADLEGDGKNEVIAGANWVHVLSGDGKLKWERYMSIFRGMFAGDFACGAVDDIDGDGRKEVVVGYSAAYPKVLSYDAAGEPRQGPKDPRYRRRLYGTYISVPRRMVTVDLFGGKKEKQIICGHGRLQGLWQDQRFRVNEGFYPHMAVAELTCFQPDPKLRAVVFAASEMTEIRAYGAWAPKKRSIRYQVIWRRTLGEKVSALLALRLKSPCADVLFAGAKTGAVYALGARDGGVVAMARLNSGRIQCFLPDEAPNAALAVTSSGKVFRLRLRAAPRAR